MAEQDPHSIQSASGQAGAPLVDVIVPELSAAAQVALKLGGDSCYRLPCRAHWLGAQREVDTARFVMPWNIKWDEPVEVINTTLEIRVIDTHRGSVWSYDHSYYPCHQDLTKRSIYSVLDWCFGAAEVRLMPALGTTSHINTSNNSRLTRSLVWSTGTICSAVCSTVCSTVWIRGHTVARPPQPDIFDLFIGT